MERLLNVGAVCELFGCKAATARKRMREMEHTEKPLMVTERAVRSWVQKHTLPPEDEIKRMMRRKGA